LNNLQHGGLFLIIKFVEAKSEIRICQYGLRGWKGLICRQSLSVMDFETCSVAKSSLGIRKMLTDHFIAPFSLSRRISH
jgi:hypothetical protein